MQNKPNLGNAKMNLNYYPTTDYEEIRFSGQSKNKPNQTQFLPADALAKEGQTQRQGVLYGIFCYRRVLR